MDYLQGMGVQGIYICGTPFLNQPWGADQYGVLDQTLLDPHQGTLVEWQKTIDALHARGMYIIVDFTINTMADLVGFPEFPTEAAPFNAKEYDVEYKPASVFAPWNVSTYLDFQVGPKPNEPLVDINCSLPRFWNVSGMPDQEYLGNFTNVVGCRNSGETSPR